MAIVPYDPFRQLNNWRKELDHFFMDFPAVFGAENSLGSIRFDVHETPNEVVAVCDIPGVEKKEDINIDVDKNTLTVSGSINRANEVTENNLVRKERFSGHFHRSITLPANVSAEGVKATYKNGVLEVRMPKVLNESHKKIDIEFH